MPDLVVRDLDGKAPPLARPSIEQSCQPREADRAFLRGVDVRISAQSAQLERQRDGHVELSEADSRHRVTRETPSAVTEALALGSALGPKLVNRPREGRRASESRAPGDVARRLLRRNPRQRQRRVACHLARKAESACPSCLRRRVVPAPITANPRSSWSRPGAQNEPGDETLSPCLTAPHSVSYTNRVL